MHTLLAIDWHLLEDKLGGEKISNLLWCVGIIAGTLLIKKPLARLIARLISNITNRFTDKKHSAVFCGLIQKPLEALLQTVLFYVALNQLNVLLNSFLLHRIKDKHEALAIRFSDITDHIFLFFMVLFTTLTLTRILDFIFHVQMDKAGELENNERMQLLPILKDVLKVVMWSIGVFWVLGTVFHVNIPALITGLGIGGVAIALAAKESVENLFGAFTILTDKPFAVGDIIKLGTIEGTVERIGFRSTRLRSEDGATIVIPNKKLVNENLENASERFNRRVKLLLNVKNGLHHQVLQQMIAEIKTSLKNIAPVLEPIDILTIGFGEDSTQVMVYYYLPTPMPHGTTLIGVKHKVNMSIHEIMDKHNAFANPTDDDAPEEEVDDTENNPPDNTFLG